MTIERIVSALFLAFPAGAALLALQDPAPSVQDLRVALRDGEPLYGELRFNTRVAIEMDTGSKAKKLEFHHETRLDYVDELVARDLPAPGDLDVRRTYLRWDQDLTEGRGKTKPTDNSFVGARALITKRGAESALELLDRLAPTTELEQLLRHSGSANWPSFPADATAGSAFPGDLSGLVRLVVGDEFAATVPSCSLTLRAVDGEGVASVDGTLTAMVENKDARGTFEGTCKLAIDTRAHAMRSVEWKGTALLVMDADAARGKLEGTFDAQLAVKVGDDARKALDRHVVYRDVPRELQQRSVAIELPSHWYAVEGEDETVETFRTTVHGADAFVTLELQFFDVPGDQFATTVDSAVSQLGKDHRLSNVKNTTSPLGKGRSLRFESKENGVEYGWLIEFYPCGKNRMVRVRMVGPAKPFDAEVREWPGALRSLGLSDAR